MNEVSPTELHVLQMMRDLKPYEKMEIKLKNNKPGEIIVTITSNLRIEYAI